MRHSWTTQSTGFSVTERTSSSTCFRKDTPESMQPGEPVKHFMEEGHVTNEVLSQYMYDRDMIIP